RKQRKPEIRHFRPASALVLPEGWLHNMSTFTLLDAVTAGRLVRWVDPSGISGNARRIYLTPSLDAKLKGAFAEKNEQSKRAELRKREVAAMMNSFTLGDATSIGTGEGCDADIKCLECETGVWDVWAWRIASGTRLTRMFGVFFCPADFVATSCHPR